MPVIATPVEHATTDSVPCADLAVVAPVDATVDGCPILTKTRTVSISKGVADGVIEWEMRDNNGNPINLSECLAACESESDSETSATETCPTIMVRFANALTEGSEYCEVEATIVDAASGLVRATVPSGVTDNAGIYVVDWALVGTSGYPLFTNRGFLSVNRSLFGEYSQAGGPPTLDEIRIQLRDTAVENSLLGAQEFSDAEIITSIMRPVQDWNETPPPVARFNTQTFPYRYNWLTAIIANLLMISAHSYARNKLNSSAAGVSLNDKDKDNPYMQVAMTLRQEWKTFILTKKVEINAKLAFGSIGSGYVGW